MTSSDRMAAYRWKLVYEDGSEFTDLDGEPWESKPWGVIFVLQPGPHEDFMRAKGGGRGYYYYRSDYGRWCACDEVGMFDQMAHYSHVIPCWRFGRNMPDRGEFKKIWMPYMDEVRGRTDG